MVDCCVLLWWDYAIFFALCSNIRIHDNQNGEMANSPQNVFINAPPPSFDALAKDKDCRFWDAIGSLVGNYIVIGDSSSITEHHSSTLCPVTTAEFVCCIHSWCWGMNGICERSKGEVFYFLGWHNSKDLPKITTISIMELQSHSHRVDSTSQTACLLSSCSR